ncbi:MAG: hypothetical protein CVU05_16225, partial [Bacteroidetes bacterium HGW-Bacteroidetes-21]
TKKLYELFEPKINFFPLSLPHISSLMLINLYRFFAVIINKLQMIIYLSKINQIIKISNNLLKIVSKLI